MPKTSYTPTEADRLTGLNVRKHRRLAGETAAETLERSGLNLGQSSFSRIELGQRALTLPEATKLAAHWNTTTDAIFVKAPPRDLTLRESIGILSTLGATKVETEQQFLGNDKPALFAVPEHVTTARPDYPRTITIDRDSPMHPDQYRAQVWVPYLEARYNAEQKAS